MQSKSLILAGSQSITSMLITALRVTMIASCRVSKGEADDTEESHSLSAADLAVGLNPEPPVRAVSDLGSGIPEDPLRISTSSPGLQPYDILYFANANSAFSVCSCITRHNSSQCSSLPPLVPRSSQHRRRPTDRAYPA